MKKSFKLDGFTLAEVLITLIVIGVIASLTVPALLQNIQDSQLKTAWKSTYSIINQATARLLIDNGGSFMNYFENSTDVRDKYAGYMSVVKECNIGQSYGKCFPAIGEIKYLDGTVLTSANVSAQFGLNTPGLVLNNGFSVLTAQYTTCQVLSDNRRYCGWIVIDVNGTKPPNTIGKDIFRVWVHDTYITPQGIQNAYNQSDCTTEGWKCGAMYLLQ